MADAARKDNPGEIFKALLAKSLSEAGGFKASGVGSGDIPFAAGTHERDAAEAFVARYNDVYKGYSSGAITHAQAASEISNIYLTTLGPVDWNPNIRMFGKSFFSKAIEGSGESIKRRMDDLLEQPAFDQYAPPSLQITDMLAKLTVAPFAMIANAWQQRSLKADFAERLERTRKVYQVGQSAKRSLNNATRLTRLSSYYGEVAEQIYSGKDPVQVVNIQKDGRDPSRVSKRRLELARDSAELKEYIAKLDSAIASAAGASGSALSDLRASYGVVTANGDSNLLGADVAQNLTVLNAKLSLDMGLDGPQLTVSGYADRLEKASEKLAMSGFESQSIGSVVSGIRSTLSPDLLADISDITSTVNHGVLDFNAQRVTEALNRATLEGRGLNAVEQTSLVVASREAEKLLSNVRLAAGADEDAFNATQRERLEKTTKAYSDLSELMRKSSSVLKELPENSEAKAAADKLKDGKLGKSLKDFLDRLMNMFKSPKGEPQPA